MGDEQDHGTYVCDHCGGEYQTGRPDADAEAEYAQLFPYEADAGVARSVVCDDCFNEFMDWLPSAQKRRSN
jgi:hypothetical protein